MMAFGAWYTRGRSKRQDYGEGSRELTELGVNIIQFSAVDHHVTAPTVDVQCGYRIRCRPPIARAYHALREFQEVAVHHGRLSKYISVLRILAKRQLQCMVLQKKVIASGRQSTNYPPHDITVRTR